MRGKMPNCSRWCGRLMRWTPSLTSFLNGQLTGTWCATRLFSRKYRRTLAHLLVKTMREKSRGALGRVAMEIEQCLGETRTVLAKEYLHGQMTFTKYQCFNRRPCSCSSYGECRWIAATLTPSRECYPGAGAKTALFAHLKTHTPSPKHGIIFQHSACTITPPGISGAG